MGLRHFRTPRRLRPWRLLHRLPGGRDRLGGDEDGHHQFGRLPGRLHLLCRFRHERRKPRALHPRRRSDHTVEARGRHGCGADLHGGADDDGAALSHLLDGVPVQRAEDQPLGASARAASRRPRDRETGLRGDGDERADRRLQPCARRRVRFVRKRAEVLLPRHQRDDVRVRRPGGAVRPRLLRQRREGQSRQDDRRRGLHPGRHDHQGERRRRAAADGRRLRRRGAGVPYLARRCGGDGRRRVPLHLQAPRQDELEPQAQRRVRHLADGRDNDEDGRTRALARGHLLDVPRSAGRPLAVRGGLVRNLLAQDRAGVRRLGRQVQCRPADHRAHELHDDRLRLPVAREHRHGQQRRMRFRDGGRVVHAQGLGG